MAEQGGTWKTLASSTAFLLATILVACSNNAPDEISVSTLTVASTSTDTAGPATTTTQPGTANWSSSIVSSPDGTSLFVVNPDSGSVTAIGLENETVLWEVQVGSGPTALAIDPSGRVVFVVVTGEHKVVALDRQTGNHLTTSTTHRQPRGILLTPDGSTVAVSANAEDTIDLFETGSLESLGSIKVGPAPWGLAVDATGDNLYVTHLLSGNLSIVDLSNRSVTAVVPTGPENNASRHVALHPDGSRAYLPLIRSRVSNPNLTFETTIMPRVAVVDLKNQRTITRELLGLDAVDQPVNMPSAMAFSRDGKTAYVANAGSNDLSVVDLEHGFGIGHIDVGTNPQGIVTSTDGSTAYVHNALSSDISVVDLITLEETHRIQVTTNPLPTDVLAGKVLFNGSFRTEMARDQWITCASCHLDTGTDHRTWLFDDGPRNTPPIRGLTATFPFHWSGDRVDLFDFQKTIIDIQAGTGLSDDENDHLAAFLGFAEISPSPFPVTDTRGEQIFNDMGCATCHVGPSLTDGLQHDVGTANGPTETKGPLIDTPTLLGLYDTAPYLHDGSATTPRDVFSIASDSSPHALVDDLSGTELDDLIAYLLSLPQT